MKITFFKNVTICSLLDMYRCSSKVHGVISRYKSITTTTMRTSNIQVYYGMVRHEKKLKTRYNISGVGMTNFGFFFFFTTRRMMIKMMMMMMIIIIIHCQQQKKLCCNDGKKSVSPLFRWVMLCQHFVRLLFRIEFISWRSFHLVLHLNPSNFVAIHSLHTGYGAIYFS